MKKSLLILLISALLSTVVALPVFAGGDKNHGDVGLGEINQGDCGDAGDTETNDAPGDDAQDNQAD